VRGDGGTIETANQINLVKHEPQTDSQQIDTRFSSIIDVGANQPTFTGTNNHNCFAFDGVQFPLSAFNHGIVDIGSAFKYGPNTLTQRASDGGSFVGNRFLFTNMGLEFYSGRHAAVGNVMIGNAANSHAYRVTGLSFTPAYGVVSAGNIGANSLTTLSLQDTATHNNHVGLFGSTGTVGVQFIEATVSNAAVQRHNIVSATLDAMGNAVFMQGAEYNIVEVNASGSTDRAIQLLNVVGSYGSGKGNWFRGIVRNNGDDRAVQVASGYDSSRFDLQIFDATGFGMVIDASDCCGEILVDGATTGIRINGNDNNLKITTRNCSSSDITVTGNGNSIVANCSGAVTCSGSGNIFTGRIAGTITGRSGNNFYGVSGEAIEGQAGVTTDGSGDYVITHNLGTLNYTASSEIIANLSSGTIGKTIVHTLGTNTVTFRAYGIKGAAVIASTALTTRHSIRRYGD
jgi:hypothetical protein